jgi:hypothetical protein
LFAVSPCFECQPRAIQIEPFVFRPFEYSIKLTMNPSNLGRHDIELVPPERFELPTSRFEAGRSGPTELRGHELFNGDCPASIVYQ